jgi:D,D-heptose 1,7-bisphosphate phosphatase
MIQACTGSSRVIEGSTVLDEASPVCSLERDLMPALASRGVLRGTVADGYFVDIGVPADLARAQTELPARLLRRALFLDLDHGWVATRERFTFVPGALTAIREASDAGWHVFVVINQSDIARGLYSETQFASLCTWMNDEIRAGGGTIDDVCYCPFHPEAPIEVYRRSSSWRKPAPGMLLDLLARWQLNPTRCLLLGDRHSDLAAVAAVGIPAHLFTGYGDLAEFAALLLRRASQT